MGEAAVLSKSQFAEHIGRHPSQVSRWIESGKLSGNALIGDGRNARIDLKVALRQLNISLNLGQQLAQANPILPGQHTLDVAAEQPGPRPLAIPAGDRDTVDAAREEQLRLNNEKLRQQIERGAREDAVAAGQLVDVGAVRKALGRQVQTLGTVFDQLPSAIAKSLADEFGLPFNEVLIKVRHAVRHQRVQLADMIETMGNQATI